MYDGEIMHGAQEEQTDIIGWAPLGHCIISAQVGIP